MHNAIYWQSYFKRVFQTHLLRTLEVLEKRLLPTFGDIHAEATSVREQTYAELLSGPSDPDQTDSSVLAQAAFDAGYDHYCGMEAARQSLINAYAPLLFHTWEQQAIAFLREEWLSQQERRDHRKWQVKELRKRLEEAGLDVAKLPSWKRIEELQDAANTVKHGDGTAARRFRGRRPDLFQVPQASNFVSPIPLSYARRVYHPMSGEDLYLTLADLQSYGRGAIAFWDELGVAMVSLAQ